MIAVFTLLFSLALAQTPPPAGAVAPPTPTPSATLDLPTGAADFSGDENSAGNNSLSGGLVNSQFIYDPTSGRDPFKMPKGVHVDRELKKAPLQSMDPLQRVNLDKVQILGIIWDSAQPRAMVKDLETSATFTIRKGIHFGLNQGIVTDIREGSIVVLEVFTNDDGDEVKIPRVIQIRNK